MPQVPVKTQQIDRNELARFLPSNAFRLIKFFENLMSDVSKTIPDAIEQSVQGPTGGASDENVVVFDGSTGFLVKDSGVPIDSLAPLESPAFTGIPTAPTAAPGTSTEQLANTAFVQALSEDLVAGPAVAVDGNVATFDGTTGKLIQDSGVAIADLAPLDSPEFTGTPEAPTAALGTDTDQIATTAFVKDAIDNLAAAASSFSAHNNGVAQSIPNGVYTVLNMSTEVFDIGGDFAANAWTPPAGRIVMLTGTVGINSTAGTATAAAIYKNGAIYKQGVTIIAGGGGNQLVSVQCIDQPNGTDVYTLLVVQTTGVAQNTLGGAQFTYFQGTTLQT